MSHPKYRPDLDGLRAVAVLAVIGFHAFPGRVRGGFVGVDIFFVISGFLISTIVFTGLEENKFSYAEFYARRVRRIFPALILLLAACLVAGWFVLPTDYEQWGKHILAGAGFGSNFAMWRDSGYFGPEVENKPLVHLWSLGVEEQFYIAWPLLLGLVWRRRQNLLRITVVLAAASFLVNVWSIQNHPLAAFYSPLSRFWEIMIGGILAYVVLHRPDRLPQRSNLASITGVLLIASGALMLNKDRAFPGWWALLPTVGAALVIAAGPNAWLNRNVLGNRAMVWVGLISYPLYLWHWPLLYAARRFYVYDLTPTLSTLARTSAVIVAVLLSWLTYRFVEKPIRSGPAKPRVAYALGGALALIAAGGGAAYATDGFVYRFPPQLIAILKLNYDYATEYRLGTCLLDTGQDESRFKDCTSGTGEHSKESVLLWGDSHAAHLYPGLQRALDARTKLTELTASACPPIVGYVDIAHPQCTGINKYVIDRIEKQRPSRVILAAIWRRYDWLRLDGTIRELKRLGIPQIDVVGPVPLWRGTLRAQLYNSYKAYKPMGTAHWVPGRMTLGLDGDDSVLDAAMEKFAAEEGVRYLSPFRILCDAEGCLTWVGSEPDAITAWDYGHLTTAGSEYVVRRFEK